MFRLFSKTIAVTFIDDSDGRRIASSNLTPTQLPDTFALNTELDLEGTRYFVVRAEPLTKAEYSKTKQLTVTLRRIETAAPSALLFSLPSICGAALPSVATKSVFGEVIVLHEDDWRQCEFVSTAQFDEISAELSAIRHIHLNEAASVGWRKIHVRERITHPLPPGTTWLTVANLMGHFEPIGGIAFGHKDDALDGVVGGRLSDQVVVWGIVSGSELQVLCVENLSQASAETMITLKTIADDLSLALIDWCRCQVHCQDVTIGVAEVMA